MGTNLKFKDSKQDYSGKSKKRNKLKNSHEETPSNLHKNKAEFLL